MYAFVMYRGLCNMIIGIMQPYFFPYLGYWQLISAVDKYVIYDDVNYIKGGWINRNRILVNGCDHYFNLPIIGASSFKKINEIKVDLDERKTGKRIRMIEGAYCKAPYYKNVIPLLIDIINCKETELSTYLTYSIKKICEWLEIETEIMLSSSIEKNNNLKSQEKVIDICQRLGATCYYNAIGGKEMYSKKDFELNGIELKFLEKKKTIYRQFGDEFVDNLSIIDVMMFNSNNTIKEMISQYTLV